ncbi:Glutathione S-transferase-like protein ustS [Metarhizium anisopliae]|nr:Glutathione S-transferase-like protein ustS [Metarhizium anisopliae]
MSTGQITLLDLPSKEPCSSWSLNPWKTRMLLNFKGLDYKTEWTEYEDIKPKVQPHLPPNESGTPYTIPTVILPDNTWIMDSRKIANHMEKSHPQPSVHLDSPILPKVEQLTSDVFYHLLAVCVARIPVNLLNSHSADYWYTTRGEAVGMPVGEFKKKYGGEVAYSGAEPFLQKITALLRDNDAGPFFMGSTVSYADFVWVSALVFFKRVDEDIYRQVLQRTGDKSVHVKLVEACEPWLQRDNY